LRRFDFGAGLAFNRTGTPRPEFSQTSPRRSNAASRDCTCKNHLDGYNQRAAGSPHTAVRFLNVCFEAVDKRDVPLRDWPLWVTSTYSYRSRSDR
jgi:hypothetical protein